MKAKICVVCGDNLSGQKQMYCNNACKQKHHYHRVKEQTNTYHSQTIRALNRKLKLVEMKSGGCSKCGYDTNLSALHFDHKDSTKKSFKLDMRVLSNRRWETILNEVEKCEILCANCHSEEHNPELTKTNVQKITNGASSRKRQDGRGLIQGNLNG